MSVKAECLPQWQDLLASAAVPVQELGEVVERPQLQIVADGAPLLDVPVTALASAFEDALPRRIEAA